MSRHCEKCCDILSDILLNLCRDNEKFLSRHKLSFKSLSLKLIMLQQIEIMSRHKKKMMLK